MIFPFTAIDIEALIGPFGGRGQITDFILAALQLSAAQRRLDSRILQLREVSAEFYLQRRVIAREYELLQFRHHALQHRQSLLPFFLRDFRRWCVIRPLDQLASRGNSHPAKYSFGLTDINLFGRKINVRAEVF